MPPWCRAVHFCGHCVEVCPNGAKKVRDDLASARQMLTLKKSVFVSLAPSYVTEFPDVKAAQMIGALKKLGFAGVSETALGAQQVSAQAAKKRRRTTRRACSHRRRVRPWWPCCKGI